MRILVAAIFFLALTAAPDTTHAQPPAAAATATPLPDVALPPALERVLRDYERAWRAGDAAGLAALFTEDGVVLQSTRPPVRGRTAIEAAYAGEGGDASPLQLRAFAFAASDTVGYILGAYRFSVEGADVGKFTLTLGREPGGRWLIASDMDNLNAAPLPRRQARLNP